jgi:hypothetical protein
MSPCCGRGKFKEMVAEVRSRGKTPRQIRIEARDKRCKARAERIRLRNEAILKSQAKIP